MTPTRRNSGIFFGWWLLGAGTVVMVMQGGLYAYGFPAFFVPLAATLGTSRGALSLAFSFTRLESSLLGPIEGYLIDRFGPRGIMYLGMALLGLSFILFSFVSSLLQFYLVFPIIALGASLSGFLPVITAVNNWFSRRRGLATGICSAGVNVGGVLVAMVALSISQYGWRSTAVIIGIVIWLLGFPLAAMMRHKPYPYGYLPDGDDPAGGRDSSSGRDSTSAEDTPDFTPMQALKTPAFWFIASAHGFSLFIVGSVSIHQIPLLVDAGISFETSATILAFMTLVAMLGRVAGGWLGDIMGRKLILVACFLLMSAGVVVLATAQTVPDFRCAQRPRTSMTSPPTSSGSHRPRSTTTRVGCTAWAVMLGGNGIRSAPAPTMIHAHRPPVRLTSMLTPMPSSGSQRHRNASVSNMCSPGTLNQRTSSLAPRSSPSGVAISMAPNAAGMTPVAVHQRT